MKVDAHLIEQLAEQLTHAVHDTLHYTPGQIHVLDLEAARRRAGADWPALSERMRSTCRQMIEARLGPHDLVLPAGDGFVVVYADAAGAAERAGILRSELDAFFLGEDAAGP